MHRALLLPEIVAIILETGQTNPGLLHSCLFVNRTFFHAASRILWYACGARVYLPDHRSPSIRNLENIASHGDEGLQRAQIYADFIQILHFQYEDDDFEKIEARWHPTLGKLKFPQLLDLETYPSNAARKFNTGDAILRYAAPSLQFANLMSTTQLSDAFLERISIQSPVLTSLSLSSDDGTISSNDLKQFLKNMSNLEHLTLSTGAHKIWSAEIFGELSKCQKLQSFDISELLEEEWFTGLDLSSTPSPFPGLYSAAADMTPGAVRQLSILQPDLSVLRLSNRDLRPLHNILAAISGFAELTSLQFQPGPGVRINGQELLQVTQGCPNLMTLEIGDNQESLPSINGITDDVIEALARGLPNLSSLVLIFESATRPSIGSLITSLGRHCPGISSIEITCRRDWATLRHVPDELVFGELMWLTFHMNERDSQPFNEMESLQILDRFMNHAPGWFPVLTSFSIEDPIHTFEGDMIEMVEDMYCGAG